VSIISLVSILVIALVVWWLVVFFSVTTGLEKVWVDKLVAVTSPIRVQPTDAYYRSYYFQIDALSTASDYTAKSIGEKVETATSDPYQDDFDEELPTFLPAADRLADGTLRDPVKDAFKIFQTLPEIARAVPYEVAISTLKLRLLRHLNNPFDETQSFITQAIYVTNFDEGNERFQKSFLPIRGSDLKNQLEMLTLNHDAIQEDTPGQLLRADQATLSKAWKAFFENTKILALQTPLRGWRPPKTFDNSKLPGDIKLKATLETSSLETAHEAQELRFKVEWKGQQEEIALGPLLIGSFEAKRQPLAESGIYLPRGYQEAGVLMGDRGYLAYYSPTASTLQEQRAPIVVEGFYDPGIFPMGGKLVVASPDLTNQIRAAAPLEESGLLNGINLSLHHIGDADNVKVQLQQAFEEAGIAPYWKIETYKEFDFSKDLIQQLQSEKHIFGLISAVIIIVACSNIISMLILLVNDKKLEIGILRSIGASAFSIASIFGIAGIVMGMLGSAMGSLLAYITLENLHPLLDFISRVQGYAAFNPMFYGGGSLPNQLSWNVLFFVWGATALLSLIAGIVPAIKASQVRPSAILRSE